MICPKCGTPNRASAKFCDECGYELPSIAPIASEIFEDEELLATCKPKSAPTADLKGIDYTNDSSFVEDCPLQEEIRDFKDQVGECCDSQSGDRNPEDSHGATIRAEKDLDDTSSKDFATTNSSDVTQAQESVQDAEITAVIEPFDVDSVDESGVSGNLDSQIAADYAEDEFAGQTAVLEPVDDDIKNEFSNFDVDKTAQLTPVATDNSSSDAKSYSVGSVDEKKNLDPKKKRNAVIVCVIAVSLVALAALTYALQLWGGKVIPDVVNLKEADAKAQVEAAGFVVEEEQMPSDEVEGLVIEMDPGAGTRAAEGSTVKLKISTKRVIPDIVGMSKDDAKLVMEKNGFTNFEFTSEKSDEKEGSVLSVTPAVDTPTKADARVAIVFAEPYRVPDVVGMSEDDAKKAIEDAGFNVSSVEAFNDDQKEGTVLSTNPEKDTALKSGSEVTITVCVHRSTKLVEAARDFFSGANHFTMDGKKYELEKVTALQWTSGGTVAFTITAHQYETVFGLQINNPTSETIQGAISFDDNSNIVAISPNIKQA